MMRGSPGAAWTGEAHARPTVRTTIPRFMGVLRATWRQAKCHARPARKTAIAHRARGKRVTVLGTFFSRAGASFGGCSARVGQLRLVYPKCLTRSEEHTSELQSRGHLVCRLLLEKKK